MDNETHHDPSKNSTGCVLLGLFPFILIGSVFAAGALEEKGNKFVGWLWIPLSILVMLMLAIIRYRVATKKQYHRFSFPVFARSVFEFFGMQILVLLVLGLIAMIILLFTGLAGFGGAGR